MRPAVAVFALVLFVFGCDKTPDQSTPTAEAAAVAAENALHNEVRIAFEAYLAEKGVVYGNLAIPVGPIVLPLKDAHVGRPALDIFLEHAPAKLKSAVDQGFFAVNFKGSRRNFFSNAPELVYEVVPTDKAHAYLKESVPDWRMAFFRIANREIDAITGVFPTGANEVKMYCRLVTTRYTPFRDWVADVYQPNEGGDVTVFLVNDGTAWHVKKVERGTV